MMKMILSVAIAMFLLSCASKGKSERSFDIGIRGKVELEYRR